jgi:hypothetical protein
MENTENKTLPLRILSFGTYNFFIRPPGIGKKEFKELRSSTLASFLYERGFNNDNPEKHLADLDIICFQEVFTPLFSDRRKKLLKTMESFHGMKYNKVSPKQPLFGFAFTNAGLITASKFPIVESDFYGFKSHKGIDAVA